MWTERALPPRTVRQHRELDVETDEETDVELELDVELDVELEGGAVGTHRWAAPPVHVWMCLHKTLNPKSLSIIIIITIIMIITIIENKNKLYLYDKFHTRNTS